MIEHIKNTLLKGFITLLPLVVTVYLSYWLIASTETAVERIVTLVLPRAFYVPGTGLLIVLGLTYIVGLFASVWLGRKLVGLGDALLSRVPLVKTIYSSMRDLLNYFDVSDDKKLNKPVLVYVESLQAHLLGFVTQEDATKLPAAIQSLDEKVIAVYLPMSYQVGGFMVFIPEANVTALDMSIEEAMQYAITAGVAASK